MRKFLVAIPLLALLVGAVWFAISQWASANAADIPPWGFAAMGFGALFSLLIGGGLMALVFYSSRHGYDDAAGGDRGPPEG